MSAVSRFTPELIEAVEKALRVNPNWSAAADYAGVDDATLWRYRHRAEIYANTHKTDTDTHDAQAETDDPDYPYWEANKRWIAARSRGEVELVATIRQLGLKGDWRALHALAKMGWPDRYSDRIEITGAQGGPVEITQEERAAGLLAQIRRSKKKPKPEEPTV